MPTGVRCFGFVPEGSFCLESLPCSSIARNRSRIAEGHSRLLGRQCRRFRARCGNSDQMESIELHRPERDNRILIADEVVTSRRRRALGTTWDSTMTALDSYGSAVG